MNEDQWEEDGSGRPLVMERMRRLGVPVAIVLAAVMVVFLAYQGPLAGAVGAFIATIVVILTLRARSTDDDTEEYGPGADDGMGPME